MATCWDVYDKVRVVVQKLDTLGHEQWRDRVDGCLFGTTSSEVLCNIAATLEELIGAQLALPDEEQRLVQEILEEAQELFNQ